MKPFVMVSVLFAGAMVSLQVSLNGRLAQGLGSPIAAALASSVVGAIALAAVLLLFGRATQVTFASANALPVWAWLGGLCGATYLTLLAMGVPRIGVAVSLSLAVAGQMVAVAAIDQFGLFGIEPQAMDALRLGGLVLVMQGAAIVGVAEVNR